MAKKIAGMDQTFFWILGGIVLVAIFLGTKNALGGVSNIFSDRADNGDLKKPDLSKTVYSEDQLKGFADLIYNAMYGFGTAEEVVFSTFTGKSVADLNAINYYFGLRKSDSALPWKKYSLSEMLVDEFNEDDRYKLKLILKGSTIVLP